MKNPALVKRYAQGLLMALQSEAEFEQIKQELEWFSRLLASHRQLDQWLVSPIVSQCRKAEVLKEILKSAPLSDKTTRFLFLILEHKRFAYFDEIVKVLPENWNELQGIAMYEITSAVPLKDDQKVKLKQRLEQVSRKKVDLTFRLDAEVLGGIMMRRGHIICDASIDGYLKKIKEIIQQG